MVVGVVLLAINLRPAAVSVGPVLAEVRADLALTATTAGLLTSMPVLAFALFGGLAPGLARRFGIHRTTLAALAIVGAGLAARAWAESGGVFLALSLAALAGMAFANVLLPSLVKQHFPDRIGPMTAVYSGALSLGLTAALVFTVPLSHLGGSWRFGLGIWAVLALLAAVPWLGLIRHDQPLEDDAARAREAPGRHVRVSDVARTRLGVAMAAFFGLQSMHAYAIFGWFAQLWRDSGYSPTAAGFLVGLVAATSVPLSFWLPSVAARRPDQRGVVLAVMACYPLAYVGLILAPYELAVVWAVLVGIGTCAFPLILTLIGLRAHTPAGTAALSGFAQSAGYLLATLGPFTVGWLHDVSGGWTLPLVFLIGIALPQTAVGLVVARPAYVEDELAERASGRA